MVLLRRKERRWYIRCTDDSSDSTPLIAATLSSSPPLKVEEANCQRYLSCWNSPSGDRLLLKFQLEQRDWSQEETGLSREVRLPKTSFTCHFTRTCCCCCCYVASVVSDSVRPQRRQPTRLPRPRDSPGKNTGVGCHFLLQFMKSEK